MTVTASRLGNAPIMVDWSHLLRSHVATAPKTALKAGEIDSESLAQAWETLRGRFSKGEIGFFDCPTKNELSQLQETEQLAARLLKSRRFTDCLFLGIGGSALGPISLLSSIQERCNSGIRFHFVENPDPCDWKTTLSRLNHETTLVCVVTKSGTTFETVSQFLLALEWLGKTYAKTNLVIITDPAKGDLRAFATQEDIPTLSIAPSIGGRFSIFTPVGLFPAALAGLSAAEFLLGAKQVKDYIEKTPIEKNPISILANELLRQAPQRTVHVCMPYSTRLRSVGSWFVQLWGESLGKDCKGFTPVAAVGATDQHSILQLLRDGPDDKITWFITVDQVEDEIKIPRFARDFASFPSFQLLEGHSLHELLKVEYEATSRVLTKQNRPNLTIKLDSLNERSMGALYFTFSVLTALTGTLMKINPFDQPGVEEGKIYTREALTRKPD